MSMQARLVRLEAERLARHDIARMRRDVEHFERVVLDAIAAVSPELRDRIGASLEQAAKREGWSA